MTNEPEQRIPPVGNTSNGGTEPAVNGQDATPNTEPATVATMPESELEAAKRQAEEYLNLLQRERADFVNYRRRSDAERSAQLQTARAEGFLAILPFLDNLERATANVPAEIADHPWVKGVLLAHDNLAAALHGEGLKRIGDIGDPFDPRLHEAFLNQPHSTIPAGHITAILRPGYRLGDRLLRTAQVAVSSGPAEPPAPSPASETSPAASSPTLEPPSSSADDSVAPADISETPPT